ncbi:hydrogenase expression/formation protein HypE [Ectobacillus ponti]|uniref:Hydrogenase expression/formation protein HypE n=1 Tax=Ectobacillus ponti TaxID=2961894 RepID=A0AA41X7R6_9BACI|nr:hydrogenase expression/formation protein HypE [Ectobacillus ponti]MCP8970367.1 hydrogenase expression/formation protein HypE [Ectobacillus ponti]
MKRISLAHGDGGELTHTLIQELFLSAFQTTASPMLDAAIVSMPANEIAVTTDSFVVQPLFFPGGDIGKLAVAGTVNDLAVSGAVPLYMTCGFIIEEGFPYADLQRIVNSIAAEAAKNGISIVAGDTKVVERGSCDGVFINTTGIGVVRHKSKAAYLQEGDAVIVSGSIGDHGIAILAARNELGFTTEVESDCASLSAMIEDVQHGTGGVRIMRDPTRGGLATSLVEICEDFGITIILEEEDLPVHPAVAGACDLLGFDPMYVANEGKVILIVSAAEAEQTLSLLRQHPEGAEAAIIGRITDTQSGELRVRTVFGATRKLRRLHGMQLPRIC